MFPMAKITDYKILSYYFPVDNLASEVYKYIKKGWTPFGNLQVTYNAEEGMVYSQAMIKVETK